MDRMGIPEKCIVDVPQKELYCPKTGEIAVEWDSMFILNYSKIAANDVMKTWPPNNTLILLEVKQS